MTVSALVLAGLFFVVSAIYASVGQAGASAYLALMALAAVPAETMRPTAFALNLVVATVALLNFRQAGIFYPRVVARFAVGSVPMSVLGGAWVVSPGPYRILVGVVLLAAAVAMLLPRPPAAGEPGEPEVAWLPAVCSGAVIGLLSGLTGTGGGIFLSPLLVLTGKAQLRQTAGIAAGFIWVNSLAALLGGLAAAPLPDVTLGIWAGCAALGAVIGSTLGRDRLSAVVLNRLMAVVLFVAGWRSVLMS